MQLQNQCLIFAIPPQAKFLLEAAWVFSQSLTLGLRFNSVMFVSKLLQDFCPNRPNTTPWPALPAAQSLLVGNPAPLQTHRQGRPVHGRGQQLPRPSQARGGADQRYLPKQSPLGSIPPLWGIRSPGAPIPAEPPGRHPQLCRSHVWPCREQRIHGRFLLPVIWLPPNLISLC